MANYIYYLYFNAILKIGGLLEETVVGKFVYLKKDSNHQSIINLIGKKTFFIFNLIL